jgi:hypothetical protein
MYNPYQPFINLMSSNLALVNRFVMSGDITRLVHESVNRSVSITRESVTKATQSHAFEELTRGLADNVARFTQDYVGSLSQSMANTQNMLSRQIEEGNRQMAQITDQVEQRSEQVGEEADAGLRAMKHGGERQARNHK